MCLYGHVNQARCCCCCIIVWCNCYIFKVNNILVIVYLSHMHSLRTNALSRGLVYDKLYNYTVYCMNCPLKVKNYLAGLKCTFTYNSYKRTEGTGTPLMFCFQMCSG